VLIVDDDAPIRELVARMLRQPGYEPFVAADEFEAIEMANKQGPFDLLITDVAMPAIQGDELARRLRHTDPDLKILYLTGYSDRLFEKRSLLWEDEAFLDKPVSVQGLLEAVSLLLVGRVPAPRSARVSIPGARVRFANGVANLETLSPTGALVQAVEEVPVGSTWPLVLELPSESVRLTGRVVSCESPKALSPDGAARRTSYAVAMAFVTPSTGARRVLERVCTANGAGSQS
jgi:CheY-like chemotaxis protein